MQRIWKRHGICVLTSLCIFGISAAAGHAEKSPATAAKRLNRRGTPTANKHPQSVSEVSGVGRVSRTSARGHKAKSECTPCSEAQVRRGTKSGRKTTAKTRPCHPPGYVDPKVRKDLNAAIRDLKRVGIKPEITSTWRSSQDQSWIYHCTSSRTCRSSHPGLYKALPPGQSAHEAGLAIDVSGIATGPRGDKHLTRQGRRIVQVMTSHGFHWRYGLADPVHFEANPKDYGYRTLKQAIWVNQTRCEAKIALAKSARGMKSIGVGRRADNRRVSQIRGKHARKGERGSSSTKQKGHNSARVLRAGTPAKVRATHG